MTDLDIDRVKLIIFLEFFGLLVFRKPILNGAPGLFTCKRLSIKLLNSMQWRIQNPVKLKMEGFAKIACKAVNYFRKTLYLRWLTRALINLCDGLALRKSFVYELGDNYFWSHWSARTKLWLNIYFKQKFWQYLEKNCQGFLFDGYKPFNVNNF